MIPVESIRHRYACEVAFSDTDASGWVHFSKILVFAERAEHDFLRAAGILVFKRVAGGWPRVKISCEYKRPLQFQDDIEVVLGLDHIGGTSLCWKFEIFKTGDVLAARGEMVTVKVDETGAVTSISQDERKLLETAHG